MEEKNALHGKVITYDELTNTLPRRDFYLNQEEYEEVNKLLRAKSKILFMPNAYIEGNYQEEKFQKAAYKIILFGVLTDGRSATVMINGIMPWFAVRVPHDKTATDFMDELRTLFNGLALSRYEFSEIQRKQFIGYSIDLPTYIKVEFHKLGDRAKALSEVLKQSMQTIHDDKCERTGYCKVFTRDNLFSISGWMEINDFNFTKIDGLKGFVITANYTDCKTVVDIPNHLKRDKVMSASWDLETYSDSGDVPLQTNETDCIFMAGMTFQWHTASHYLLRVVLVDLPCDPHPEHLTVVCGKESTIIKAFAKIMRLMSPDYIIGFNDSSYDWPWLMERAAKTKGLPMFVANEIDRTTTYSWQAAKTDDDIMKWNYREETVKLEAGTDAEGHILSVPGMIPVDVRTVFRKLYPTAEKSSLNWFLEKNRIASKEDMPYKTIFQTYRELRAMIRDSEDLNVLEKDTTYKTLKHTMSKIASYCVVDAQRCHELMLKRNVIIDKREVATISYTSIYDAFYRADGGRVKNLTFAEGQQPLFNLGFSSNFEKKVSEGKYPGAYVIPPKTGLLSSKLSIDESIQIATTTVDESDKQKYAIWKTVSAEDVSTFKKYIAENSAYKSLDDVDKSLHPALISFLTTPMQRPTTGLDFSSLYPSIIRANNFSPEKIIFDKEYAKMMVAEGHRLVKISFNYNGRPIQAWSVHHENHIDPADPKFNFGVYAFILQKLFEKRDVVKKQMKAVDAEIEHLEATVGGIPADKMDHYGDLVFTKNALNSKQLAIKVYMNTFYGIMGSNTSSFFLLEIAGGITSWGRTYLQTVEKFVKERDFNVYYGDTDSLYIASPESCFAEIDKKYYSGEMLKKDYWTQMVEITFRESTRIQTEVNAMLREMTGTGFLKMAYEEVLHPAAYLAKKKYAAIQHENIVNYNPKNLFIRGLDLKKRGASNLMITTNMEILWQAFSVDNIYSLRELVQRKIDYIYNHKWDHKDFLKSDVFKPNKQNVKVHAFVERMRDLGVIVPPYERFNYVIVRKYPYKYDFRGRKIALGVGDFMEFPDKVESGEYQIDLDYYMKGGVNGQFGRMIVYHKDFYVEAEDDSDDAQHVAENKIYKLACDWIENYCSKYYAQYVSKGKLYQQAFRTASGIVSSKISSVVQNRVIMQLLSKTDMENFMDFITASIKKYATVMTATFGEMFINKQLDDLEKKYADKKEYITARKKMIVDLQKVYFGGTDNIETSRTKRYKDCYNILSSRMVQQIRKLNVVIKNQVELLTQVSNILITSKKLDKQYLKPGDKVLAWSEIPDTTPDVDAVVDKTCEAGVNKLLSADNLQTLRDISTTYQLMINNEIMIEKTKSTIAYLKSLKNKELHHCVQPKDLAAQLEEAADEMTAEFIASGMKF